MFGLFKKRATPKQRRAAEVIQRLRESASRAAREFPGIAGSETLAHHASVLGEVVPETVAAIGFTDANVYADMWQRHDSYFDDLATLVTWTLVTHTFKDPTDQEREFTETLLQVGASIYPASERARGLLARYNALTVDPSELKARRVLMLYPGSDDLEARGTVFPALVNEVLDGPALDGPNFDDPGDDPEFERCLDPADAFFIRQWLCRLETGALVAYRKAFGITASEVVPEVDR